MLTRFNQKLETYLNNDQELQRRLKGFKTFCGLPDGHYERARQGGVKTIARAVKCYPFGGESLLGDGEIIGLNVIDGQGKSQCVVSLKDKIFSIDSSSNATPHLSLELPKTLFVRTLLGRHRWLWVIGMEEVKVTYATHLPHSDWVTIFEILVAMQEMAEFDTEMWKEIETL